RRLETPGFDISVWDRTKSKAEALHVGHVVDSPADAARNADVLITMVTGPQALRDVYFGPSGVFTAGADSTIVDMSTVGPAAARELADAAELHGAKLVEAPVIGSIPAVNSGTLLILAGAALVEDLEPVRPVLEQLGEVHYVGDVGSAATLKLVANSFLAIVSAGAAELMAAGTAQGLDPEQVFTVLSRVAPGLKVREAGFVRNIHAAAVGPTAGEARTTRPRSQPSGTRSHPASTGSIRPPSMGSAIPRKSSGGRCARSPPASVPSCLRRAG